jgi:hypothetical protein
MEEVWSTSIAGVGVLGSPIRAKPPPAQKFVALNDASQQAN